MQIQMKDPLNTEKTQKFSDLSQAGAPLKGQVEAPLKTRASESRLQDYTPGAESPPPPSLLERSSRATAADISAINSLVNSCYRGDISKIGWTSEADLLGGQRTDHEMLSELIRNPDKLLFLFWSPKHADRTESEPELQGCVVLETVHSADSLIGAQANDGNSAAQKRQAPSNKVAHLGMLCVSPRLQKSGMGKLILEFCEYWARNELGCDILEMEVIKQRPELISWYQRRGFASTGKTLPFPYGDERFGQPKRLDLEFVVLQKNLRP